MSNESLRLKVYIYVSLIIYTLKRAKFVHPEMNPLSAKSMKIAQVHKNEEELLIDRFIEP